MRNNPNPRDVERRRFVVYQVRRSGGREVWRAYRGARVASRFGFPALRRMLGGRHMRRPDRFEFPGLRYACK